MNKQLTAKQMLFGSVKSKTIATAVAIIVAVALPQMFHLLGRLSGLGTALGEVFLPMHIAVIAIGLTAGPLAGVVVGALSPILSYALTAMPTMAMLPFMTIELIGYGLVAGLLSKIRINCFCKVLIAQLAGRVLRALATIIAVYGFSQVISLESLAYTVTKGLLGIILQWTLIPLALYYAEKTKNERIATKSAD